MEKISGIIFDIDGTITSTFKLIFATFNHVVGKHLNKTVTDEEIINLFGPTEDVILKEWMSENYDEARRDYYNFYEDNHEEMVDEIIGLKELIKLIKSKNIPLGIYTGKGRSSTDITLKKIGLYDYFDLIITGDDVQESKPSPEGIIKFVEQFNLNREEIIMIGDAPADIYAAKNAGIKIATVLWDSYCRDEVLSLKSDYYFNTVNELNNFITERI